MSVALFLVIFAALGNAHAADPIADQITDQVDNFHMIEPGKIYRGAHLTDQGVQALAQAGIKTIIDLRGGDQLFGITLEPGETPAQIDDERKAAESAGLQFFNRPMAAINPFEGHEEPRIHEVLAMISDPALQPVYFHCEMGKDRTGLIAALYRVFEQACTPESAHAEMKEYGHLPVLFWFDIYFKLRVRNDPRTQSAQSGPSCPLR